MPFFSRRRIQLMLNELSDVVPRNKITGYIKQLESGKQQYAISTEMELAFLWLLSKSGPIDVEPAWWPTSRLPDVYTEHLIQGKKICFDITTVEDNSLSYKQRMNNAAQIIDNLAGGFKRKIGKHLRYTFGEESSYSNGKYRRIVRVPEKYEPSGEAIEKLKKWILSDHYKICPLIYTDGILLVKISWIEDIRKGGQKTFTSKPVQAYSLDENPLYASLVAKKDQLKNAPTGVHRVILLADRASSLLNDLGRSRDPSGRSVSAQEIISHFIHQNHGDVDAVVCFVSQDEDRTSVYNRNRVWRGFVFSEEPFASELIAAFDQLLTYMPKPLVVGYQVRSLHRQGAFKANSSWWYKGYSFKTGASIPMEIRFSARALLDFLAGRLSEERFREIVGAKINLQSDNGSKEINVFLNQLEQGKTINELALEERDVDAEDDQVVLTFADDPSARNFKIS